MSTLLYILIAALVVVLSAAANAVADRLENHVAYNASVFKTWNRKFWLKEVSWQYAKKIGNYKIDGWHLAESVQVLLLLAALVAPLFIETARLKIVFVVTLYMAYGLLYNWVFNITYKKLGVDNEKD